MLRFLLIAAALGSSVTFASAQMLPGSDRPVPPPDPVTSPAAQAGSAETPAGEPDVDPVPSLEDVPLPQESPRTAGLASGDAEAEDPPDQGAAAEDAPSAKETPAVEEERRDDTGPEAPSSPDSGENDAQRPDTEESAEVAPETAEPQAPADEAAGSGASAEAAAASEEAAPAEPLMPVEDVPVPQKRPAVPDDRPAEEESANETESPAAYSSDGLRADDGQPITAEDGVEAAAAVEAAMGCEAELAARGVEFTVGESVSEGQCGVLRPIRIERLSSGAAVVPDTKLRCQAVLVLDEWINEDVLPAARENLGTDSLERVAQASTYVCRRRSSGPKISEHARGNAIDIGALLFEGDRRVAVKARPRDVPEAKFQRAIRQAACGPFKTVLGPGTDAAHATHFHLDLATRRNGYTYCE